MERPSGIHFHREQGAYCTEIGVCRVSAFGAFGFMAEGLEFKPWGVGVEVEGLGFGMFGRFRAQSLGFTVLGGGLGIYEPLPKLLVSP